MATSPSSGLMSSLYTDLCPQRDEIRLLILAPSDSPHHEIKASLSVVSLSDHPCYEALSYVWGPEADGITKISLSSHLEAVKDSVSVSVTKNLFAALQAFRDRKESKTLWVDALCINQSDNTEKESQVLLMQDIYSKCAICYIWLGKAKANGETDVAIKLLENWSSDRHLSININFNSTWVTIATELTRHAWFSRTWTVQESILPSELVVLCGPYKIPWKVLADAAKYVNKHLVSPCCNLHNDSKKKYVQDIKTFLHAILTIERSRKSRLVKSEILSCLHYYRDRKSTNPEDKVFGLRSLVNATGETLMKIEYGRNAEDVYTHVCMEHIRQTRSLEILKYILWSDSSNKPSDKPSEKEAKLREKLPSWVPDWTLKIPEPRWQKGRLDRYSLYAADAKTSSHAVVTGKYVLTDRAVRCGVATSVGTERPARTEREKAKGDVEGKEGKVIFWSKWGPKPVKDEENSGRSIPKDWVAIAKARKLLEDKKSNFDFWSTILMDSVAETSTQHMTPLRRAKPADYDEYEALLTDVVQGTGWPKETDRIYSALESATLLRRFFITEDGAFGIGPARMQEKDEVFVVRGCKWPLVLRSTGQRGRYKLIGDCFLAGFMKGEAMRDFVSRAFEICIE